METPEKARFPLMLALVGPGILVAATGVGAGDLATAAFAGNKLGVAVLWAVVMGAFLKYVLNEGLARWQLATGETLLEGAIGRFGRTVWVVFLVYLLLWSFFVGAALISASGVALHAIVPIFEDPVRGKIVLGMGQSFVGVGLVLLGGFGLFRKVMLACIGLMFMTVVATAIRLCADWPGVLSGLLIPRIPGVEGSGLGWTVALMGGVGGTLTVLCYGYWMQETGRSGRESLRQCRLDLALAYAGTAVFGICMVIIGSALPELPPGGGAMLVVRLADLLQDTLGPIARWAFLLGAWSAIFSSLFGVWQSVPYLFADLWTMRGWRRGISNTGQPEARDLTRTPAYRNYLWAIAVVPLLGLFVEFRQVQQVYAVFGALFMPMLALLLLVLNGRRGWMGDLRNRTPTVVVLLGTLAVFLYFGWFKIFA